MKSFYKDPDAKKPYGVDWTAWLASEGDTIATVSWNVPDGITVESVTPAQPKPAVWLSGGTVGQSYPITCHIVTTGGLIDDKTFAVIIREQ